MATNSEKAKDAAAAAEAAKASAMDQVWRAYDDEAARYVCGTRLKKFKGGTPRVESDLGQWSEQFAAHPIVMRAEYEGWGRELRQHCRVAVKRLLMQGWNPASLPEVGALLPPDDWIQAARREAARAKKAEAWRSRVIEEHGSVAEYIKRVRPEGAR
jgi:hypothetical protein